MKKFLLLIAIVLISVPIYAVTVVTVDKLTYTVNDDGVSVTLVGLEIDYENPNPSAFEEVTVPATITTNEGTTYTVTAISSYAFGEMVNIKVLNIGSNVSMIGIDAFYPCVGLQQINVSDENQHYTSQDGVLYTKDMTILVCCPDNGNRYNGNEILTGVKTIAKHAFANCSVLKSVVIPSSVSTIENNAFEGCQSLVSVTLNDGLTSIGDDIFSGCIRLNELISLAAVPPTIRETTFGQTFEILYVPDESLEAYKEADVWKLFGSIIPLSQVTIFYREDFKFSVNEDRSSVTLESYNINFCAKRIVIPETVDFSYMTFNVTIIQDKAFSNCRAEEICIPRTVTSIGENAFEDCAKLESVVMADNLITIGAMAFSGCTSLTNVKFPNTVTTIGEKAFYGCTSLTNVMIPSTVTTIGGRAFYGCSSLKTLELNANISMLEEYTFAYCECLVKVDISSPLNTIAPNAFFSCKMLNDITLPMSLETIRSDAFYGCSSLESIVIPPMTATVEGAFSYSGLISLNIPSSVTSIGKSYGCYSLQAINVSASNPNYTSTDGVLYDKGTTHLLWCPQGITNVTIPSTVVKIEDWAFKDCINLTSLSIPSSVNAIGKVAFYGCKKLESINIANSVSEIGESAFCNCTSLIEINFPNSLKVLNSRLCLQCDNLKKVSIPASIEKIEGNVFSRCFSLERIDVDEANTTYSSIDGVLYDKEQKILILCPAKTTDLVIPNTVTDIKYMDDCNKNLQSIVFGDGFKQINKSFSHFTSLRSVVIGNSVDTISGGVFRGCTNLTSLVLGEAVKTIGQYAFYETPALTQIKSLNTTAPECTDIFDNITFSLATLCIPQGCKESYETHPWSEFRDVVEGDKAIRFMDNGIKYGIACGEAVVMGYDGNKNSVVIPIDVAYGNEVYPVTSIDREAFKPWVGIKYNLVRATIPESIEQIQSQAFSGCEYISEIYSLNPIPPTVVGEFSDIDPSKAILYVPNKSIESYKSADGWSHFANIQGVYSVTSFNIDGIIYTTSSDDATAVVSGLTYPIKTSYTILSEVEHDNKKYKVTGISTDVFADQSAITDVTIPEGIISIGNSAFSGCSSLTSIVLPNSVESLDSYAFYGCSNLVSIEMPEKASYIGRYAFDNCTRLEAIRIPEGVTAIYDNTFWGCENLKSISLPNTVNTLGAYAFFSCINLPSIELPNAITSIGEKAFQACISLTSIRLPENITKISTGMLACCYSLKSIEIPESVTTIENDAFDCCKELESIVIPNSVTSIGEYAFNACESLTSATIGCSVSSIGHYAFYHSGLTSVNSLNPVPPTCGTGSFTGVAYKASLFVPEEGIKDYLAAEPWMYFSKICSIGFSERLAEAEAMYDKVTAAYEVLHGKLKDLLTEYDGIAASIENISREIGDLRSQLDELEDASATYTMTPDEQQEFDVAYASVSDKVNDLSHRVDELQSALETVGNMINRSTEVYPTALSQRREEIASATMLAELDAVIAELDGIMGKIEADIQSYEGISITEISDAIPAIEEEVDQCKNSIVGLYDFLASGIDEILSDENRTIEVVGLDGHRWSMTAGELHKLLPGIYVVKVGGLTVKVAL